jgi:Zn-dependent metalloprotease
MGGGLLFAQKHNPKYLREDDKAFKEITKRTTSNGFIEFKEEAKVSAADFFTKYAQNLGLGQHYELQIIKDETDKLQIRHQRYQLYYKKTPVEGAEFTLHSKGGLLFLANGRIVDGMDFDLSKPIPEQKALDFALADKKMSKDDFKGKEKAPEGKLVIALVGDDFSKESFKMAYTFDLYGKRGLLDAHKVFVDGITGSILKREPLIFNCFGHSHLPLPNITQADVKEEETTTHVIAKPLVPSTFIPRFQNRYGNLRDFETENFNNNLRLSMNNGALITRRDANNVWNVANNPEQTFTGNNEVLNPTFTWGANQQNSTTTHWSIQRSYEYFRDVHGQNGPNNDGNIARVIVDIAGLRSEAFWIPSMRIIGIGFAPLNQNGGVNQNNSLATLDICAHEYTHAITQFTASLSVNGEPRSLNEGLSDIFGTDFESLDYKVQSSNTFGAAV